MSDVGGGIFNECTVDNVDIKKVKVKINGKEVNQREPDLFEQLMNGDIEF